MKWSEFVSRINAEIAKSDPPIADPEIGYIDYMNWYDGDDFYIHISDEGLSITD